jgi:glycosyltransferase involved in cell wall biosynthesis
LKLLHITHQYRPAIGGAEEYIASLSEALVTRGHEVSVYTANSTDYESWTGDLPPREIIAGVDVHRFRAIPRRKLTWWLLRRGMWPYLIHPRLRYEPLILVGNGPTCPGLFASMLAVGRRYDLVHLNALHYAHTAYGYVAARMTGRPVVVTPNVHVEQRETWDVGYMRGILAHADLVFAQTEYERQFHIRRGRDPEWVVVSGVGLRPAEYVFPDQAAARRQLGIPADAQVVLCLGRQVEYKGLDKVIAALATLRAEFPRAFCLIVGPESEWSQAIMANYVGADWLRNLGHVTAETKLAALSAADVMAMPSHGESFGVTYIESWFAGRPVIGLAKGAVQTLIEDGTDGLLVPPDDDIALTQALRYCLEDPEAALRMGSAGREKALGHYTLDKTVDRIEGACLRLVEAQRRRHAGQPAQSEPGR